MNGRKLIPVLGLVLGAMACTPEVGTLTVTPVQASLSVGQAQTQGVAVSVSYSGPGYDPLKLTAYAALDNDPWQITQTKSRQVPQVTLAWPGTLTPPEDGSGHLTRAVTMRIQLTYAVGRESVQGRTAVTITP